jgi:uncharacterized protein with GYD domain
MPTYVLLGALNHAGRKTLHGQPERIAEVKKEITDLGCKVLHQYSLLGPYDILTVVEAPDHETVAHVAADLHSRGTVEVTTLPAVDVETLVHKLKNRKEHGH